MDGLARGDIGPDRSLLILDDDEPFLRRLGRAMEKRGFEVTAVDSVADGPRRWPTAGRRPTRWSTCGSRTATASTSSALLRARRPDARIVVLTGYGAIASAVAAVKIGATDYLAKPADANDVTVRAARARRRQARAAGEPDVGRPGALGAYPAHLRALRPQRLGDRAAAQHAPPHAAAHPGQAQPEVAAQRFVNTCREDGGASAAAVPLPPQAAEGSRCKLSRV